MTLDDELWDFKDRHFLDVSKTGTFPEKVRLALEEDIVGDPETWERLTKKMGARLIVDRFMVRQWLHDRPVKKQKKKTANDDTPPGETPETDEGEPEQGDLFYQFNGKRLATDVTYEDDTAGRFALRTVHIRDALMWQWLLATKLIERNLDVQKRAHEARVQLDKELLASAKGDLNAKVIDQCTAAPPK